jgi:hypothetical protein
LVQALSAGALAGGYAVIAVIMRRLLCLACAGCLAPLALGAPSPVYLSVDARVRGYAVPETFAGLSFETWAEGPDRSGVPGHLFSPTNAQVITLFRNSGIRTLRLGGCTVEGAKATVPNRADIDNAFGFARAAGVKVIYSLGLLNGDAAKDAATAKYVWAHYRPLLAGFAIGNEPDVKSYLYPPFGNGIDPSITNYPSYLAAWRKFTAAIIRAVPQATFVGPDAAAISQGWAARFVKDVGGTCRLTVATQHEYVGGRPFRNGTREPLTAQEAIDDMLSVAWVTNKYPYYCGETQARVAVSGLACRMTEANDYLHGVTNASNAFASALWALDYMHWWAAHGCVGVDFHNNQQFEWLKTDTVYLDGHSRDYQANPKAYGIRAFDLGSRGWTKAVTIGNAAELNLTAYAVGDATNLCVTVINKEHGTGGRDAVVEIAPVGFPFRYAAAQFLTAPNGEAGATNDVTIGGAPIRNDAAWQGAWTNLNLRVDGLCQVVVRATSAAVVKLSP